MRLEKIIVLFFLSASSVFATDVFNAPVQFTTGSSIAITSGVPLTGTWDFTGATSVLGIPPATITLTGNATGSGTTSIPVTIGTIPDLVAEPAV